MTTRRGDRPASPQFSVNVFNDPLIKGGMTIREKFAMAAMQGLVSARPGVRCPELAHQAIAHADALLRELERTQ